jgi:predicted DNA-binding protein with PD1-like motif
MPTLKQAASIILSRIPENRGGSAFVITAVGSLKDVTLRLANASRTDGGQNDANDIKRYMRRFEIVSLTGTFSRNDGCHIHISLADAEGNTIGGHLVDGVVFTTCEVVLGTADGVEFLREMDRETGYRELVSIQLPQPNAGQSIMNKIATVVLIAAVGCIVGRLRFK